jgi:hypothetical protein
LKIENREFDGKKWEYHTNEEYFLLKIFENNHECVPFGLFITKCCTPRPD